MKYKMLMVIISIMMFLFVFTAGEASENIIGSYETSKEKILFNNGVNDFELDTYEIKIGNDKLGEKFICLENLQTLGYSMKWNPQKRETRFTQLKTSMGAPTITEEENKIQFQKKVIQNISQKLSGSGQIYKSDVRIFINGDEVPTYNMGGYSFVSLKELRRLDVDFFFEYGKMNMVSEKRVYKIVQNKDKYGLVTSDGIVTAKPEYDEILIPEENVNNVLARKDKDYFVISKNGEVIKEIDIPSEIHSRMCEKNNFIEIYTYISDLKETHYTILSTKGEKVLEGNYEIFRFLDNNYWYAKDDENSLVYLLLNNKIERILTLSKDIEVYGVDGEFIYFQSRIYIKGEDGNGYYDLSNAGIMNMDGEIVLPPSNYKMICPFRGDYAVVLLENDRYTFINKEFNRTTIKDFKDITSVHNGAAVFLADGEYNGRNTGTGLEGALFGIVDSKGDIIAFPNYKMLKIYDNDLVKFAKIDIKKEMNEYGQIEIIEDYDNLRYGVMTLDEKVIISQEYEKIEKKDGQFYCLKENTVYIYDMNGELISKNENLKDVSFDKEFYFIRFWDDKKSLEDLPGWPNSSDNSKLPEGIENSTDIYFKDSRSAYQIGYLKVFVTKGGLKIPTETYTKGLVAPPPNYYFPTYLWKE